MTEASLRRRVATATERGVATRRLGLWALAAVMVMAAVAVAAGLPAGAVPGTPLDMPWWAVAVAFALSEAAVIHIPVERNTHTISMSEIPLVLGLAFASPAGLVAGRLAGSAVVLARKRRQSPAKLAFNLAMFALETVLAVVVYRALLDGESPNSPYGWAAALIAVVAGIVVSVSAVNVAMAVQSGRPLPSIRVKPFVSGVLISLGMGFVGTLCLLTVWHDIRAAFVLGGAAALFFVLIRVYGSLSRRHDDLRAMYSFTSAAGAADTVRRLTEVTLGEVARLLHAERAALLVAEGAAVRGTVIADDGSVVVLHSLPQFEQLASRAAGPAEARVYSPDSRPRALDVCFGPAERTAGLISPMTMSDGTVGVLVAEGRVGPVREFSRDSLELLDALAGHCALAIERALIVERLTEEVAAKRELVESKDRLIAAVSHELRTPLTGILGFAEAIRDEVGGPEVADPVAFAAIIASNALDMSHLVEDLLAAARATDGRLPVHLAGISLRDLAEEVIEQGAHDPTVVSGEAGLAIGDEVRVRQILRNLISNAGRYGGAALRIVVTSDDDASHVLVQDDGTGIPVAMREDVFAPYRSAHETRTQPGSLGLGLSTSRMLARLMDGELTYDYCDGWSTFRLTLPRRVTH